MRSRDIIRDALNITWMLIEGVAILAVVFSVLFLILSGCSHPTAPVESIRRYRPVTISGPNTPAILSLSYEITTATGLPSSYIGNTGEGNMTFIISSIDTSCSLTTYTKMRDGEIIYTTHTFPSLLAMENLDPTAIYGGTCNQRSNTALHEAGHGLGLDHPQSPCTEDVMCIDAGRRTLRSWGPGDLRRLRELYQ